MNLKRILTLLAPFTLVILALVFVYNIYSHGHMDHPGKAMYKVRCAQCHGENGEGIKTLVPPIGDRTFTETNFDSLPCWLKNGMSHPITIAGKTYDQPMYPNQLDDIQTANVINYLSHEFAGMDKDINSAWVRQKWQDCK